ncbi:MAG: ribosome recycling factor [Patescibacteria group bacterium]|jgi:ribosome recycling factor
MDSVKNELIQKIAGAQQHLIAEFAGVRSGRANAALLDKIQVDVYGQKMPINNLATVAVPEPRQLLVQPWDKANVGAVEKAIVAADLGLGIVNEGDKIRVSIPLLSNERREELVKLTQRITEEAKVGVRNLRREAFEALDKRSNDGGVSEDELERWRRECQTLIDNAIAEIDKLAIAKAAELRAV